VLRVIRSCRRIGACRRIRPSPNGPKGSDLSRFFDQFPDRVLAADLFTVFEMGRIRIAFSTGIRPGSPVLPLLRAAALDAQRHRPFSTFCDGLLLRVALAVRERMAAPGCRPRCSALHHAEAFEKRIGAESPWKHPLS